jgi:hypothetical protein
MQTPTSRRNPKGRRRYASHRCLAVVAQTFLSAVPWQAGPPEAGKNACPTEPMLHPAPPIPARPFRYLHLVAPTRRRVPTGTGSK